MKRGENSKVKHQIFLQISQGTFPPEAMTRFISHQPLKPHSQREGLRRSSPWLKWGGGDIGSWVLSYHNSLSSVYRGGR